MPLYGWIHPVLGVIIATAMIGAYVVKVLLPPEQRNLHYTLGLIAFIGTGVIVAIGIVVVLRWYAIGLEQDLPSVLVGHYYTGWGILGVLVIQAILGIYMWVTKTTDIAERNRTYKVHLVLGNLLALATVVQVVLGVLTLIGILRIDRSLFG